MTKIQTLKKKYNDALASRDSLCSEVDRLTELQKSLIDQAQERAETGDIEGYMKLKADAEKTEAKLYVKQMQLKKAEHPISIEEAEDAWKSYTKSADKEFESAWSRYESKRRELAQHLEVLMEMQQERLKTREDCLKYATGEFDENLALSPAFKCFLLDGAKVGNDRLFFRRLDVLSVNDDMRYAMLLACRNSV